MKNKILAISFLISTSLFSASNYACGGIQNLDTIKKTLIQYHDSGLYEKNIATTIAQTKKYLQSRIDSKQPNEKLAIVLDIDETALSNYSDMVTLNFGGTFDDIMRAEAKGTDPAIKPTLDLYLYAKAHGVATFFVTGRTEQYRNITMQNLLGAGYRDWDGLTLKPENYHNKSVVSYKSNARKQIADKGYTIVLNIGDQDTDLAGGYSEKNIKLPNPYYLIS